MPPNPLSASLEAGSAVRVLAPDELLFRQGDPAAAIYKVESGRLRLIRRTIDDHLVILHTADRGEFFAEASLFADAYHCDAVAAAPSSVRMYPKEIVMEAMRTDPALAEAFMGAARPPTTRTADADGTPQHPLGAGSHFAIPATSCRSPRSQHLDRGQLQDIAAEIGITREALYRKLAALEAEGLLTRTETVIKLKKSDGP